MCGSRQRKCIISYLALFAFAFQLFISFGHVQLTRFISTNIGVVDDSAFLQRQNEPSQNIPDEERERCSICAIIGLAGSLLVPDPHIFAPPVNQYCESFSYFGSFHNSIVERVYFQSRAPPSVKSA
jgi:hypothetical protein